MVKMVFIFGLLQWIWIPGIQCMLVLLYFIILFSSFSYKFIENILLDFRVLSSYFFCFPLTLRNLFNGPDWDWMFWFLENTEFYSNGLYSFDYVNFQMILVFSIVTLHHSLDPSFGRGQAKENIYKRVGWMGFQKGSWEIFELNYVHKHYLLLNNHHRVKLV